MAIVDGNARLAFMALRRRSYRIPRTTGKTRSRYLSTGILFLLVMDLLCTELLRLYDRRLACSAAEQ
jgi:hypothetical protein